MIFVSFRTKYILHRVILYPTLSVQQFTRKDVPATFVEAMGNRFKSLHEFLRW